MACVGRKKDHVLVMADKYGASLVTALIPWQLNSALDLHTLRMGLVKYHL